MEHDDLFGISVASLGDVDGDGIVDMAVGAYRDDDGADPRGAVYVLTLNTNGSGKAFQKISDTEVGYTATFDNAKGE